MQAHATRFFIVGIHFFVLSWLDSRWGPEIVLPKGYGGNRPFYSVGTGDSSPEVLRP